MSCDASSLRLAAMTEARARSMAGWVYDAEYAEYDHPEWETMVERGWGLTRPETRRREFMALLDPAGTCVGFVRLKEEADHVMIGLGLRPDHCGRGLGEQVVTLLKAEARRRAGGKRLRLEVRGFNQRAIRCYQKAGFEVVGTIDRTTASGPGYFLVMEHPVEPG